MKGKVCVITGANSGVGKETARELALKGAHVVMVCRNPAKAGHAQVEIQKSAPGAGVDVLIADLSRQDHIRKVADEIALKYDRLHVLVNNAGRHLFRRETTPDGFEMNFALNCLAPFLLTNLLLDKMKESAPARVVNVVSEAHRVPGRIDLDDLNTEHASMGLAYGKAKFGSLLLTRALARRLAETGVTANAVCPGLVATNIFSNFLPLWFGSVASVLARLRIMSTPERGARMQVRLATDPDLETVSGEFYTSHPFMKLFPPLRRTLDIGLQERLWE